MFIDSQDELHVEYQGIALTCPHCQTLTHLTAVAHAEFEELSHRRPKHIGIVFAATPAANPYSSNSRSGLHGAAHGARAAITPRSSGRAKIFR